MEQWKDIKGYEGKYQISNLGRVKSLYGKQERMLSQKKQNCGYLQVRLSLNGVAKTYSVHRLVAQAFVSNPENKTEVNHINEDKADNRASNLNWMNPKENTNYGTHNRRMSQSKSKKVLWIEKNEIFNSPAEIAQLLDTRPENIRRACRGERKTACGFHFQYV